MCRFWRVLCLQGRDRYEDLADNMAINSFLLQHIGEAFESEKENMTINSRRHFQCEPSAYISNTQGSTSECTASTEVVFENPGHIL